MDNSDKAYLDNWQIESFSKTMDFSLAAQKSIFTLNGAAAIAIFKRRQNAVVSSKAPNSQT